jgi:F0F1-type ATP synthase epsilon subunit
VADRLTLELATPTRMVVAEAVDEVVIPGSQGYFGVLPGHAPLLATLGIGELTYRNGREERHMAVAGGFAEVRPRGRCPRAGADPPSGRRPRPLTATAQRAGRAAWPAGQ